MEFQLTPEDENALIQDEDHVSWTYISRFIYSCLTLVIFILVFFNYPMVIYSAYDNKYIRRVSNTNATLIQEFSSSNASIIFIKLNYL